MAADGLLFFCVVQSYLAGFFTLSHDLIHEYDEMIRHIPLEPSHILKRRSVDQPLRISLDFLDINNLENPSMVKDILKQAQIYFSRTLKVRKTTSKILLQRSCPNQTFFSKNADGNGPGRVRFCQESCNSSRILCGPVEIPEHDLDQCRVCDANGQNCHNDTKPGFTAGEGHKDTDFILYVTAVTHGNCVNSSTTLAYGSACQQESGLDRPVVGFINICPKKVTASELRSSYSEVLATVKHEIFHALGFAPSLFAFFRNHSGEPLTARRFNGLPKEFDPVLKHYKWSEQTVKVVTRNDWLTKYGTMPHDVYMMVTPRVREEARRHFNCSTLEGAELENQGGEGTALAHWEKRLFENEAMTGVSTQSTVFSRMTLALMEDSGWYIVNYEMADPLRWGKNLGCLFAKKSCAAWMKAQTAVGKSIAPFCSKIKREDDPQTGCSIDRTSVASCNLVEYEQDLPTEFQNFLPGSNPGISGSEDRYGGAVALADFCPFYQSFTWTQKGGDVRTSSCISRHNALSFDLNYALEFYNSSSRCFEQRTKWIKEKCGTRYTAVNFGSGCYKIHCEPDALKVEIAAGLKYPCFHKGQVLNISVQVDMWSFQGTLVCPSCKEVCSDNGFVCPAEIRPAPKNSQPTQKKSPVTCSQCSVVFQQVLHTHLLIVITCTVSTLVIEV